MLECVLSDPDYFVIEITIAGIDSEAGGTHTGIVLGYHW